MRSNGVGPETAAFDAIYAEFNGRLFGFLVRLTGRREVAEELLEDTWLRFVRRGPQPGSGTPVGPWLFAVARNLAVSHYRTRATESRVLGSLSLWPEPRPETPFDTMARGEAQAQLESALAGLPPLLREALLLVGVEGMTPSDAAAVCAVTPEAMRQRIKRARALLAARLGWAPGEWRLEEGA